MRAVAEGAAAATVLLSRRDAAAGLQEARVAGGRWLSATLEEGEGIEGKIGGGGGRRLDIR
jgi:hypothetical protein